MRAFLLGLLVSFGATALNGAPVNGVFQSIEGGDLDLSAYRGGPVLVVNTASLCGFTGQYEDMQVLYDTYRDKGLTVVAVPSNDFNQELNSAAEVKDFCEVRFDLDMPLADITPVTGQGAHPFFLAVAKETGFVPRWNFNKILLSPTGEVVGTWGSLTKPMSSAIRAAVEEQLQG